VNTTPRTAPEAVAEAAAEAAHEYRRAFELAPIGLVLSRARQMLDVNRAAREMFGATVREQLLGHSFELLYPTHDEFERTGQRIAGRLDADGRYADDRVMKRLNGEMFWCHVSGRSLDPAHPHAEGIWAFEDLSAKRALKQEFTAREREIAALLIEGLTSKGIGRRLEISPRTVDVDRSRLMRKLGAASTAELIHRPLSGRPSP
jgi:PAS domain S-box-containing protein